MLIIHLYTQIGLFWLLRVFPDQLDSIQSSQLFK